MGRVEKMTPWLPGFVVIDPRKEYKYRLNFGYDRTDVLLLELIVWGDESARVVNASLLKIIKEGA